MVGYEVGAAGARGEGELFLGPGHFLVFSGVEVRCSWGSWDEVESLWLVSFLL